MKTVKITAELTLTPEMFKEWCCEDENSFLRNKAREFCSILTLPAHYHTDYMQRIAMYAYRHFALKYKELMK